jgi:uncharacterized cupin superfamily protein
MAPTIKPITVVHNFGGRRCVGEPKQVQTWGVWDCDPTKDASPTQRHAYGSEFPWTFDMEEKAYILEGSATLTARDEAKHGKPVTIGPKDMVTFPAGWAGRWNVHAFLKKRYAFYDREGIQIDEDTDDDDDVGHECTATVATATATPSATTTECSIADSVKAADMKNDEINGRNIDSNEDTSINLKKRKQSSEPVPACDNLDSSSLTLLEKKLKVEQYIL